LRDGIPRGVTSSFQQGAENEQPFCFIDGEFLLHGALLYLNREARTRTAVFHLLDETGRIRLCKDYLEVREV
jgi:hypothetical protein